MKRIKLFSLMVLVGLLCCACGDEKQSEVQASVATMQNQTSETQAKTVSSLYETEALMSVTVSDVEFQIPESWDSDKKESGEWTYYFYDDLMLAVNVADETDYTNEDLIAEKESFADGMLSSDGTEELLYYDVIEISGEDALEVLIKQTVNETLYYMNTVTFIYNAKQYIFCWIVEAETETDYSEDYISLKDSIAFKEIETTEWTLLKQEEYTISNSTIKLSLMETEGTERLMVDSHAENEEYASLIFVGTATEIASLEYDFIAYNVAVYCGDRMVMYIKNQAGTYITGTNSDGKYTLSTPDWIMVDEEEYTLSTNEINSVLQEAAGIVQDFMEGSSTESDVEEDPLAEIRKNPVYCDEAVNIYFSGISDKGVEFWVENLTENSLMVQADSVAINGISTNSIIMSDNVSPLSVGKVVARCDDFKSDTKVTSVSGQLRVIDKSNSSRTIVTFANVTIDTEGSSTKSDTQEEQLSEMKKNLVYCDEAVNIYFSGISNKGVEFWVENLTEINLTIQADSVAVNGVSTSSIVMSDCVAPLSIGKVVARCDDFKSVTKVTMVSGQLRIIDMIDHSIRNTATFANVTIE